MRRLMIIDDEFIFRQGLKYMMDWEANNYTIAGEASNGKESLELFLKLQPDIVLCDVVMPGISGIQFVAMLRRYSKAPIVMLSNFNEFDKVREAFQYGASDYLLKNRVTKDSLLECLNRLGPAKESLLSGQTEKTFGLLARFVEHTFYSSLRYARNQAQNFSEISRIELKLFKQLDYIFTFSQFCEAVTSAYGELTVLCSGSQTPDLIFTELEDYLEQHYMEQVSLYDLADNLHMNYSYLSAYISRKTGKHFSEHLNDTRIRHAKELLSVTNFSISYISETIGYADQSYFGKVFKKQVGMTPLQFRNQYQRKD
ncbi:MAG: response regulator [Sellimonas intestinalis]